MTQTVEKKRTLLGRISVFLAQNISDDVIKSGKPENLILIAKKYVKLSVISAIIIYPTIGLLLISAQQEATFLEEETIRIRELNRELERQSFLDRTISFEKQPLPKLVLTPIVIPISLALAAVPPVILAYPKIFHKNLSKTRKKNVEEDLPFFSLYASIMQSVNKNLYSSFLMTLDKGVFKAIEKEAMLIKRNVELFGRSPLEAIEELARSHESQLFKNFLLGYTSIARSGGDLTKYLENSANDHFETLKMRYDSYAKNLGYIVESLIIIFVVVPVLFVVGAFILPTQSINQILIASAIGVPMTTLVFAIILENLQPRMYNLIGLKDHTAIIFIPLAMVIFFVSFFVGLEFWVALAISAIIPSVLMEIFTTRHRYQINKVEKTLPVFLRDITEYKKIGIQESSAITKLNEDNTYGKTFDRLLRTLSSSIKQGYSLAEVISLIKLRSWFASVTFFILSQISESGGGNPAVLEEVTKFVRNMELTLKQAKASIAVYDILGFLSPVLLVFTIATINEMTNTIAIPEVPSSYSFAVAFEGFEKLVQNSPEFLTTIKTFVITSSIAMGVLLGKASDGTFKSTGRIAILCTLALISIYITENMSLLEIFG